MTVHECAPLLSLNLFFSPAFSFSRKDPAGQRTFLRLKHITVETSSMITHSAFSFFLFHSFLALFSRTKQHQSGEPTGPWSGNKISPPPSYDVNILAVRHGVFGSVGLHWPLALAAHRDIRATLHGAEPGF
ncbi:D-isomer specific 2-hydroxyacid dehydrogenase, NAD binding domain [Carpediemonas membranifera]|uniref:D-isomer specific 2-hydroxyacid dehydrogenase, NAD binding domain n=1 Tax=Carpediemonas membranifera TaxID=201153 RepID=A0A8J6B2N4_9EUKA|nr:D-isomer specific 2-hydroxyacid dehydrogenase, NAD binding domain [Carpediemonas membranifera]|eukprot:KAG9394428.1 D-isomer specific 2-hydroxyacid dehydrogenase, NAD binding domain [Carpediemonas membranifera]